MRGETKGGGTASGVWINESPPDNKKMLWIDISKGGIAKYYDNGQWKPIATTWG